MGATKEINIKNRTYYFYNDIIDLDEFDESKIRVDKKVFNDIDIYYLGYEYKKKITECNVIRSVNPLYLRIVDIKGQFGKGKDDAWYLVISDKDDFYKRLVDILKSIKNKITEKTRDALEYDKDYMKIKFESNNIFPTDKDVNIHLSTIVIRAIFAKGGKYYPQLFLDGDLYKMLAYERIDISDGIDINKPYESKKCTLCHY